MTLSQQRQVEFAYWYKERCNIPYAPPDNVLGLKCVKEKDHTGKHVFYVDWNVFS